MRTTVHFASNRALSGGADRPASYSLALGDPLAITYATAFVEGVDVAGGATGRIDSIENPATGGFAPAAVDDLSAPGRNLLVFIHGFANSFTDAVTRAAFNREFLARSGAAVTDCTVIAFAWPSQGRVVGIPVIEGLEAPYRADQRMARDSGPAAMRFLANLEPLLKAARARGNRSWLLCHSMGNLVLQNAVEQWFAAGNGDAALFDRAFLAAGDCGFDAFAQPGTAGLSGLARLSRRIAFYASRRDEILNLSRAVNGVVRLGHAGPQGYPAGFAPAAYSLFDATGVNDYETNPMSSHQYYRLSPTVRARIAADMAEG